MKKIRILFYLPDFSWGGLAHRFYNIISNLNPERYRIGIAVNFDAGNFPGFKNLSNVHLYTLLSVHQKIKFSIVPIIQKLKEIMEDYDIVICGGLLYNCLFCALTKLLYHLNTKLIFTILQEPFQYYNCNFKKYLEFLIYRIFTQKYASLTICACSLLAKKYAKVFKPPLKFLYPPSNSERIIEMSREEVESELFSSKYNFISYGWFKYPKRFDIIIKAFKYLKDINYKLILIGDGSEKHNLINLAKELRINVKFLPYTSNPFKYLARSYAFLFASECEGFGKVIVESFVLGKQVVSTPTKYGPLEIIRDGENGLLTKDFNPENFASCIRKIIENPQLYQKLSKNAKLSAEKYDIKKIIPQFEKIIEDVLKKEDENFFINI